MSQDALHFKIFQIGTVGAAWESVTGVWFIAGLKELTLPAPSDGHFPYLGFWRETPLQNMWVLCDRVWEGLGLGWTLTFCCCCHCYYGLVASLLRVGKRRFSTWKQVKIPEVRSQGAAAPCITKVSCGSTVISALSLSKMWGCLPLSGWGRKVCLMGVCHCFSMILHVRNYCSVASFRCPLPNPIRRSRYPRLSEIGDISSPSYCILFGSFPVDRATLLKI